MEYPLTTCGMCSEEYDDRVGHGCPWGDHNDEDNITDYDLLRILRPKREFIKTHYCNYCEMKVIDVDLKKHGETEEHKKYEREHMERKARNEIIHQRRLREREQEMEVIYRKKQRIMADRRKSELKNLIKNKRRQIEDLGETRKTKKLEKARKELAKLEREMNILNSL
jgi:hypothetical protein